MPAPWVNDALKTFRDGQLADAEARCRAALARTPDDPDGVPLYVAVLSAQRRFEEAVTWQRRVLAMSPTAAELRRLAGLLEMAGDGAAALPVWEEAHRLEPSNPRGLNNLGKSLTEHGDLGRAIELLRKAIELSPRYPIAYTNLGRALTRAGRLEEAVSALETAIAQDPAAEDAYLNLSTAHARARRFKESLAALDQAARRVPPSPTAQLQRGSMLLGARDAAAALSVYEQVILARPALVEAHAGRIRALLMQKQPAAALEAASRARAQFARNALIMALEAESQAAAGRDDLAQVIVEEALRLDPAQADAQFVQATLLRRQGKHDAALARYDALLSTHGDDVRTLYGKALSLEALGRDFEAFDCYDLALGSGIAPAEVHSDAALLCERLGRCEAALQIYERLLANEPEHALGLYGRATMLQNVGRVDEALPAYELAATRVPHLQALRNDWFVAELAACEWRRYDEMREQLDALALKGEDAGPPLAFLYHNDRPRSQQALARRKARQFEAPVEPGLRAQPLYGGRPLRVGYVSPDFRSHPVAELITQVLEAHDRSRVQAVGYALGAPDEGPERARIARACAEFHALEPITDVELAARLRADAIDIAVDLAGYTVGGRTGAFARRMAPVQVNYLGYPGTLGAPWYDYIIADRQVITEPQFFDEQPAFLPGCFFPAVRAGVELGGTTREAAGLPATGVLFGALHTAHKIGPAHFAAWMEILRAVPGSSLVLRHAINSVKTHLAREAGRLGVDPERLVFAPRASTMDDYRRRLALLDVFLDTGPYNAHTTAGDALGAGVPLLTVTGRGFAARVATSLLDAFGLPELAFPSIEEYARAAIRLGRSPAELAALRERLHHLLATTSLYDGRRYTAHLEAAYLAMHERAVSGQPPAPIEVSGTAGG